MLTCTVTSSYSVGEKKKMCTRVFPVVKGLCPPDLQIRSFLAYIMLAKKTLVYFCMELFALPHFINHLSSYYLVLTEVDKDEN